VNIGRAIAAVVVTLAAVGAVLACGDTRLAFDAPAGADHPDAGDAGAFEPPSGSADAGTVGAASGVYLLHAASFPAFRLCFERYPELRPQPDQTVMPRANVVGVEVGSVVRIGSLERPPGKVFVIMQRKLPAAPGDTGGRPCGELLASGDLTPNLEYHEAGELTEPLGVGHVSVLGITGCGGKAILDSLEIPSSNCGAGWDVTAGSLRTRTLTLVPSVPATRSSLPVQVVHMSPLLESTRGQNEHIEVSFGALVASAGRLAQDVVSAPPLFEASAPVALTLDQTSEATYGTHGFRIAVQSVDDGAPPSFTVTQSLAEIQELSSPQTVPTTYYLAASNYVLLLLGDPQITRTLPDGGTNGDYDRRRAVHLLAVPVKDTTDAGEPTALDDASASER